MKKCFILIVLALVSCGGIPDNIKPVTDFKIEKYAGTWYEIARFDHSFESGLQRVTANYTLRADGGVKVINRGFMASTNKWKESEGKAFFAEGKDKGYLKVSFFGPFYASYVIFYLDENYQYSLVTGHNKSYFWILSRTPHITDATKAMLVGKAKALGFNMDKLIYVDQ